MEKQPVQKFYNKDWFLWVSLIFFAPLGVFLLWKNQKYNKNARIFLTIIFALFFIKIVSDPSISDSKVSTSNLQTPTVSVAPSLKPSPKPTPTPTLSPAEKAKIAAAKKAAAKKAAAEKAKADYKAWIDGQFSFWDGSHIALVKLVKENLNDPGSFKHDKTVYWDKGTYILIKMTYRAKNAFGALILQNVTAKADYKTNMLKIISTND